MDKCQFSEFSYGYCVTEDLVIGAQMPLLVAPVFPSLVEEGKTGVGYDVQLNRPGTLLFLQFKIVHQMVTSKANEAKRGHFNPPFYRMHLRSKAISDQHESLLSLEHSGNDVFYVAPAFHRTTDLNDAYAQHRVWDRSFRLKPSDIGPLPDERCHHITFQEAGGLWRFYSEEPSRAGRAQRTGDIIRELEARIEEKGKHTLRNQIEQLDEKLRAIVEARNNERRSHERLNYDSLGTNVSSLRRIAYTARQFFDCQVFFVIRRNNA